VARGSSPGSRGGLRTVALVAAVAIALASTAAVVLSDDPEMLRLAVVGALWAFVLAAFAAPRRREPEPVASDPGSALELRRTYEIELEKEVAARREYELQLEVYLRRELERGLAEDVAALRDEVGRMRGEMIDRLDGELRMERIETTRLIGGSLRALRDEARRLGIGMPVPPELASPLEAEPVDPLGSSSGQPDYGAPAGPATYPPSGGQPDFGAPGYPPTGSFPGFGEPAPAYGTGRPYAPYPSYAEPEPAGPPPMPPPPPSPPPPAPRAPVAGESLPPRRRRAREDGEDNEVMSRLLGR
jgi:hypothetical protein